MQPFLPPSDVCASKLCTSEPRAATAKSEVVEYLGRANRRVLIARFSSCNVVGTLQQYLVMVLASVCRFELYFKPAVVGLIPTNANIPLCNTEVPLGITTTTHLPHCAQTKPYQIYLSNDVTPLEETQSSDTLLYLIYMKHQ